MSNRKAQAALAAVCELDLPAAALVPLLLEALHDVVPSARNLMDWTDDDGRLLHYFIEGPVDEAVAKHYFDVFHNRRETEVMPAFDSLAQAAAGIRSASELDNRRFFESALYHEIWRPQDLKYRLEAVLRSAEGALIGSLVLYRGPRERCFSRSDEAALTQVLPMLAAALQRSREAQPGSRFIARPQATQSLLLGIDAQVCHATAGARRQLMLASGGITRERLEMPLTLLAAPILDPLLRQLRCGTAAVLTQHNAFGAFTFRAQALSPQPVPAAGAIGNGALAGTAALVQVMLHWAEPQVAALQRAIRTLPLTAGQQLVCRELYEGRSQQLIGARLGVAPTTVIDHVRKLYRALEVRSVIELRALIDAAMHTAGDEGFALRT